MDREEETARKKTLGEEFKPEELKWLNAGVSNRGYHYLGAAKILALICQAFAEELVRTKAATQRPEPGVGLAKWLNRSQGHPTGAEGKETKLPNDLHRAWEE